jgi:hypothetical protein
MIRENKGKVNVVNFWNKKQPIRSHASREHMQSGQNLQERGSWELTVAMYVSQRLAAGSDKKDLK